MLDTLAVSRQLTEAGVKPEHADAITHVVQRAAEHGDHLTTDQFKTGLAEVRTEIAHLNGQISRHIATLETQISAGIAGLQSEVHDKLRAEVADLRADMQTRLAGVQTEIASLDTRLSTKIADVRTVVSASESGLVKWIVGAAMTAAIASAGITTVFLRILDSMPR